MTVWKRIQLAFPLFLCALLVLPVGSSAIRSDRVEPNRVPAGPESPLVLDGVNVHNIGELGNNMTNWGLVGSMPGSGMPFQNEPSAEWPLGSGVQHLYAAGLWVGAIKSGVPAVSTSAYAFEFRPTSDPVDVMYHTSKGAPNGNRYPSVDADDDGDGMVDEDWLNGRDDDLDGLIDEDFAAISDQMFSCWYTDNQPEAIAIYPQHNPLDIMVRQESYEWSEAGFNDFIGIEYTITNIGTEVLEDVYVGFFADLGIGLRTTPNYWEDDATGSWVDFLCTMYGGAPLDFAYAYDADGDGGQVTSYIGFTFLDYPTDPAGVLAPPAVGLGSYNSFAGNLPYEDGGDPTNDFERYEMMSNHDRDRNSGTPRDYRQLISAGPFASFAPGESFTVQVGLVVGDGLFGLRDNMALIQLTYDGAWYNLDGNPLTGIAGRETPVFGPAQGVVVDSCRGTPPIDVPAGAVVWVNADCAAEEYTRIACGYTEADSALYMTGVGGREYNVHWILPPQNPVPVFVSGFDAEAVGSGVALNWNVVSDEDIRGFRIYRQTGEFERLEILNTDGLIAPESRSYTDTSVRAGETYSYMLGVVLADNSEVVSPTARVTLASAALRLDQNHPNPFNPRTTISFTVPDRAHVRLAIYSPDGRLVRTLIDGAVPGGFNEISWDGRDANGSPVSSGVYFYRLETGKRMLARKMVYLK